MILKVCKKCDVEKPIGSFHMDAARRYGTRAECKACLALYNSKKYILNKSTIDAQNKAWYESNKADRAISIESYRRKNQKRFYEVRRSRMANDPLFGLKIRLRDRISHAFSAKSWRKKSGSSVLLGADYETVKAHIARKFTKGMSWDNIGEWHIDHIIPLSSAKDEVELMTLCHYRNLQPLWAVDNFTKGSIIPQVQLSIAI